MRFEWTIFFLRENFATFDTLHSYGRDIYNKNLFRNFQVKLVLLDAGRSY